MTHTEGEDEGSGTIERVQIVSYIRVIVQVFLEVYGLSCKHPQSSVK